MAEGPLLALDVGGGTQDLFLWQPGEKVENAVKLVLPAPTRILARRVRRLTEQGRALFLTGELMGGGAVTWAVRQHLAQGWPVFATPRAALTLHDHLETVRSWGVVVTEEPPPGAVPLQLGDIDLQALKTLCSLYELPFPQHFAVAVQDHGFSPGASNREFRFALWRKALERGGRLMDLAYFDPPAPLTRMAAITRQLPGALVMDTCIAGVRGALLEPRAREHLPKGLMVLNLGNAHTFAVLIREDRIYGVYEHHTGMLTPEKLAQQLVRFQAGVLKHEEVFADGGHGCAIHPEYLEGAPFAFTVITGPRRALARKWPGFFAAPFGDLMLTGCFGLVQAWLEKQNLGVSLGGTEDSA